MAVGIEDFAAIVATVVFVAGGVNEGVVGRHQAVAQVITQVDTLALSISHLNTTAKHIIRIAAGMAL